MDHRVAAMILNGLLAGQVVFGALAVAVLLFAAQAPVEGDAGVTASLATDAILR